MHESHYLQITYYSYLSNNSKLARFLSTTQEVQVLNQNHRQKYCRILKRWHLQTNITGKHITGFQIDTGVALQKIFP